MLVPGPVPEPVGLKPGRTSCVVRSFLGDKEENIGTANEMG